MSIKTRTLRHEDEQYGFTYQFDIDVGQDFGTFFVLRGDKMVLTAPGTLHMGVHDERQPTRRSILSVGRHFAKQIRGGTK